MPPVGQQGSRAGLITAVVVSVILNMVFIVLWLVSNYNYNAEHQIAENMRKKYQSVVTEGALSSDDVNALLAARKDLGIPSATAMDAALRERGDLVQLIKGNQDTFEAGQAAAQAAMN